ncbi:MAG TPA: COX15/CtaA family protein [Burkholderiaceae bacterium]|nr:COX15/CtaA family protein [Burkholderiaceae bacterium]
MIRLAVLIALVLTICITGSSAFIRHTQAGVGCPARDACRVSTAAPANTAVTSRDGPGQETASRDAPGQAIASQAAEPSADVRTARLMHRVSAMAVGLLAGIIALVGWSSLRGSERAAAAFALLVTGALAWLGRYTPHDLPLVTLGNVLGGFALAAGFAWIAAPAPPPGTARRPLGLLAVALLLVFVQAGLGVMISVRHAVDACAALVCLPAEAIDWRLFNPLVAGLPESVGGAQALHLAHRLSALGLLAVCLAVTLRTRGAARLAVVGLLLLQGLLGFATATGQQPLLAATAHNMTAAALVALITVMAAQAVKPAPRDVRTGGA